MRNIIVLDPKLLEQLRLEAAGRGVSVETLLNSAIGAGLVAGLAEPAASHLAPTVSLGQPRVNLDRALLVADALEDEEHGT